MYDPRKSQQSLIVVVIVVVVVVVFILVIILLTNLAVPLTCDIQLKTNLQKRKYCVIYRIV